MAKQKTNGEDATDAGAYPRLLWNPETGEEITVQSEAEHDAKSAEGYVEKPPEPPDATHPIAPERPERKPHPEPPIVKPTPNPLHNRK